MQVHEQSRENKEALANFVDRKNQVESMLRKQSWSEMIGMDQERSRQNNEEYAHIPVIMYSTSSHQREIDIAINLGALSFFTKPHSYKELKNMMKEVIDKMQSDKLELLRLKASNA